MMTNFISQAYYLHLEKNSHIKHVDKVKGRVGDPGRLELVQRLSALPNIHDKEKGDKDQLV